MIGRIDKRRRAVLFGQQRRQAQPFGVRRAPLIGLIEDLREREPFGLQSCEVGHDRLAADVEVDHRRLQRLDLDDHQVHAGGGAETGAPACPHRPALVEPLARFDEGRFRQQLPRRAAPDQQPGIDGVKRQRPGVRHQGEIRESLRDDRRLRPQRSNRLPGRDQHHDHTDECRADAQL